MSGTAPMPARRPAPRLLRPMERGPGFAALLHAGRNACQPAVAGTTTKGRTVLIHNRAAVLLLAAVMGAASGVSASAAPWADVLDEPLGVEVVDRGTVEAPLPQITCTTFRDFTLIEADTDSPAPEAASIVPAASLARTKGCAEAANGAAGARMLDTGGTRFVGRKGAFLFFEEASTNGSVPFFVIDAASGRNLFDDTTAEGEVDELSLGGDGVLRMRFRRAVDGNCSIPQEGTACWTQITQDSAVPPSIRALPAPVETCRRNAQATAIEGAEESPSIVSFAVAVEFKAKTLAAVAAGGPIECWPTP